MKNKSTYSLLLHADAEEKGRSIFETGVYSLVILCTAVSFWTFAAHTTKLPGEAAVKPQPTAVLAQTLPDQPAYASSN